MKNALKVLLGLVFLIRAGFAQVDFSRFQGECLGNFLADQPPIIEKVEAVKAEAGSDIEVEATVYSDEELTDDVVTDVTLHYSTDGGESWETVAMEPKNPEAETPKDWVGKIPAQESGTTVKFYVSAKDTSGNVATEVPGKVSSWPPSGQEEEAKFLPVGLEDEECSKMNVADMDILGLSFGYDDEKIYGKIKIRGKFSGGTTSPPHINAYITGVLPPEQGIMDLIGMFAGGIGGGAGSNLEGAVYLFAPLAKELGATAVGLTKNHAMINSQSVQNIPNLFLSYDEAASTDDGLDTDTLYFSFARKIAGSKRTSWKAAAGALYLTCADLIGTLTGGGGGSSDFLNCLGPDIDLALYLNTYFQSHEVTVK